MEAFSILPDPQTNGGLLIAVNPGSIDEVKEVLKEYGLEKFSEPIGKFIEKNEKMIYILE
jgi:selenide, water dikinase